MASPISHPQPYPIPATSLPPACRPHDAPQLLALTHS
jgi:hypothetical protein